MEGDVVEERGRGGKVTIDARGRGERRVVRQVGV